MKKLTLIVTRKNKVGYDVECKEIPELKVSVTTADQIKDNFSAVFDQYISDQNSAGNFLKRENYRFVLSYKN